MLGATLILVPRFEPMEVLQTIKRLRPTFMPASPAYFLIQLLSQVQGVRKYGMASIRVCFSGGSNLPVEVQESFEKLTKGRVVDAYNWLESGISRQPIGRSQTHRRHRSALARCGGSLGAPRDWR